MSMSETDAPITMTFKFGTGFDAPWLVLRSESPDQMGEQIQLFAKNPDIHQALDAGDLFLAMALLGAEASAKSGIAGMSQPQPQGSAGASKPNRQSGGWARSSGQQPQEQSGPPVAAQSGGWGNSGGQRQQSNWGGQQPGQRQWGGQQQDGPVCNHGQMSYRDGQGKRGPWAAWFCPLDRDDPNKCPTIDAESGKPWRN